MGMYLVSTSDKLRIKTDAGANVDVHAWWTDFSSGSIAIGRLNTPISTATTTDVVASPGSGVERHVKTVSVRNKDTSKACAITVIHTDGTTAVELMRVNLSPGFALEFAEDEGWIVTDQYGMQQVAVDLVFAAQTTGDTRFFVLDKDVVNNCASADRMLSIPGLEFPVEAGTHTYFFRAVIIYTAAATTTGARFSIFGDAVWTTLMYQWEASLTTTSKTNGEGFTGYDSPSAANGSSAATGANFAIVEGFVVGTLQNATINVRVGSEVANSAITVKAGSFVHLQKMS